MGYSFSLCEGDKLKIINKKSEIESEFFKNYIKMAKKTKKKEPELFDQIEIDPIQQRMLNVCEDLNKRYVFMEDTLDALKFAFTCQKNLVLYGPGGHNKSTIIDEFYRGMGLDPFFFTMGSGTTRDILFGGIDIKEINSSGKIHYLIENSFMNHEYVVFEEMLDAPDYILEQLKDVLSSGIFRNGAQTFKIKTKQILCATNRTREEFAKNSSLKALLERFPLEVEVKWKEYTSIQYRKLFETTRSFASDALLFVLDHLSKNGQRISPRIAIMAQDMMMACGPDCFKAIADFNQKPEVLKEALTKFKSIEEAGEFMLKIEELMCAINENPLSSSDEILIGNKKLKELETVYNKASKLKLDDTIAIEFSKKLDSVKLQIDTKKKDLELLI